MKGLSKALLLGKIKMAAGFILAVAVVAAGAIALTKPIEGTIRAKDTHELLAGVVVYGAEDAHRRGVRAVTDGQGRYRLLGLPKATSYEVVVYPHAGQNYLKMVKSVADSEGLRPLIADFELRRGVPVRFRLIDKETRKLVRTLQYTPLGRVF